jgi:hypothetical protein
MDQNSSLSEGEKSKISVSTTVKTAISSNRTLSKNALLKFFNRCKNKNNDSPKEDNEIRASSKKIKSIRSGGKSALVSKVINGRYKADKAKSVVGLLVGFAPKNNEGKSEII